MHDKLTIQYSLSWVWLPTGNPGNRILYHSCGSQMWAPTRKGKIITGIIAKGDEESEEGGITWWPQEILEKLHKLTLAQNLR